MVYSITEKLTHGHTVLRYDCRRLCRLGLYEACWHLVDGNLRHFVEPTRPMVLMLPPIRRNVHGVHGINSGIQMSETPAGEEWWRGINGTRTTKRHHQLQQKNTIVNVLLWQCVRNMCLIFAFRGGAVLPSFFFSEALQLSTRAPTRVAQVGTAFVSCMGLASLASALSNASSYSEHVRPFALFVCVQLAGPNASS
jgi:hypothetical protein